MKKLDKIFDITIENFVDYLDKNFSNSVFIKFCKEPEIALCNANGLYCFGTLEYYRNQYSGDGLGDPEESISRFPAFGGNIFGVSGPINISYIATCLSYCFVEYSHTDSDREKLVKMLKREKNVGMYAVVFLNNNELIESLENLAFYDCLDNPKCTPILGTGGHRKIHYCDKPLDDGFQKRNIQIYEEQLEHRYNYNFKIKDTGIDKDTLKNRFIFKGKSCKCNIYKIMK